MRWPVLLLFLLSSLLPLTAEDWKTVDGKTYKNVTNIQPEDDGVTITYTGGTTKIPYYNLTPDIQKQLGQDIASVEAKVKAAAEAESARRALALSKQKQLDEQAKQQAANAAKLKTVTDSKVPKPTAPLPGTLPPSGEKPPFPGGVYTYDKAGNLSYFDSPSINMTSLPISLTPGAQGPQTSLTVRAISHGPKPEFPDKLLVTFLSVGQTRKFAENHDVVLSYDGASLPIADSETKTRDSIPGFSQVVEYITFYLTPEQASKVFYAQSVQISVGTSKFVIDPTSLDKVRKYLASLDQLPQPPSYLVQKFREFTYNLPPWSTMISQTCVYIILCGFFLFIMVCAGAVWVGATRFFKM